jgi:DNA-binding beta-propeller fold protein YncE
MRSFVSRESEESILRPGPLRLGFELSLRLARRVAPYPRLWARLSGARIPDGYITGSGAGLFRPESVAFSPSGALMAISNSGQHSISLYARGGVSGRGYEERPCGTISDANCLSYVHDSAFSPCGRYLVAVGEESHSLAMFELQGGDSKEPAAKLLWAVRGEEFGLNFPASVAIHPSGRYLAVANRERNGITLYRGSGSNGQFDSTPFQMIATETDFQNHGLGAPHGVDFSPNGESLIVTHKRFWKSEYQKGESGVSMFRCRPEPELGLEPDPSFILPCGRSALHLAAFHPSGEVVAVSNSMHGVDVYSWQPEQRAMSKLDSLPIYRVREGAKGVAFTRDGGQLVVTTDLHEVLFFDLV